MKNILEERLSNMHKRWRIYLEERFRKILDWSAPFVHKLWYVLPAANPVA